MHKSRLSTFVIDCQGDDVEAATQFWSAALGRKAYKVPDDDPLYRLLKSRPDEALLLVQKVDHESRIHLDIETDDLDAEVARLEKLGAKRIAFVKQRWWVMEAPTGQRFCVVHPQRGPLGDDANQWP
jgi:hypothetical protein